MVYRRWPGPAVPGLRWALALQPEMHAGNSVAGSPIEEYGLGGDGRRRGAGYVFLQQKPLLLRWPDAKPKGPDHVLPNSGSGQGGSERR